MTELRAISVLNILDHVDMFAYCQDLPRFRPLNMHCRNGVTIPSFGNFSDGVYITAKERLWLCQQADETIPNGNSPWQLVTHHANVLVCRLFGFLYVIYCLCFCLQKLNGILIVRHTFSMVLVKVINSQSS